MGRRRFRRSTPSHNRTRLSRACSAAVPVRSVGDALAGYERDGRRRLRRQRESTEPTTSLFERPDFTRRSREPGYSGEAGGCSSAPTSEQRLDTTSSSRSLSASISTAGGRFLRELRQTHDVCGQPDRELFAGVFRRPVSRHSQRPHRGPSAPSAVTTPQVTSMRCRTKRRPASVTASHGTGHCHLRRRSAHSV